MKSIKLKRVYEVASKADGYRILVDRIWPRGIKKEDAHLEEWNKEIAPTTETRKEFNHDPERFARFKKQYMEELNENEATEPFIKEVLEKLKDDTVTLVYAAKDEQNNQAVVLKEYIEKMGKLKK